MTSSATRRQRHPSARAQRGVGLIEVLIAVLIMGIGLLGIAAMQATALRNSQSSLERSQAVMQTYAILDRMRANRVQAISGSYNRTMTCAPSGGTDLVGRDVDAWLTSMQTMMGAGSQACGQIQCAAVGTAGANCTVTVQWDESHATADGAKTAGSQTYQLATEALL